MKRLLVLFFPLLFLTSCLDGIVSGMLYPYESANKDDKIPEPPPAPLQVFKVTGQDGHLTYGWYVKQNEKAPVVLYFHGNGENIASDIGMVPKVLSMGVNFAIFDYPKYGLSTGELNEKGVLQAGQDAINFVKMQFPQSQIIVWGRSLGCAPATILTSKNQDVVTKLILTSPWDEFWRVVKAKTGFSDQTCKDSTKGNEYLSDVAAKNITVPVFIHHGTEDKVVPFELGKNLSKAFASKDVTFMPIEGAGHNGLMGDKQWEEVLQFVRK